MKIQKIARAIGQIDDDLISAATQKASKSIWLPWGAIAACFLVQVVDILGDDGSQLALFFELGEGKMCGIGASLTQKEIPVETIKLLGARKEIIVAQYLLGRRTVLTHGGVDAVLAAVIFEPTLR